MALSPLLSTMVLIIIRTNFVVSPRDQFECNLFTYIYIIIIIIIAEGNKFGWIFHYV